MRFPSLALLLTQAKVVLRRFPWTLAAGVFAAVAAIIASLPGDGGDWPRVTAVALLALPVTISLTLLGEARDWSRAKRTTAILLGLLALVAFYLAWPGLDRRHDALRYFQLSAGLHLAVSFLPFLGIPESGGFWQYNRRLFLGFLRAAIFSNVLFIGVAIALGALDKLFGVDIGETYIRVWFIVAFVVNTWIFLAAVPEDLAALEQDREYPRALKVFAQYILTPLVFTYLVILLAYLVKIVAGGEWPSGWIGWLVGSVSVTGLLGFLLVHPLRADPGEGWIRTYSRWLFVGLIPAALMLLVAFWKRIMPYGLTEPRMLGLVLGIWLLGLAILYTLRSSTGIRIIPVTLSAILLATLYGPWSLTSVSVSSQGRRLAETLQGGDGKVADAREASGALRFLIDHRADREIAMRIGRDLPPIDWAAMTRWGGERDSLGREIMQLVGVKYVPYSRYQSDGYYSISSQQPLAVDGFDWAVTVATGDAATHVLGGDTVRIVSEPRGGTVARFRVGSDTLAFDLGPLAAWADTTGGNGGSAPPERVRIAGPEGARRSALVISNLSGNRERDSLAVSYWTGTLLLTR